jgi:hypothetical protein
MTEDKDVNDDKMLPSVELSQNLMQLAVLVANITDIIITITHYSIIHY